MQPARAAPRPRSSVVVNARHGAGEQQIERAAQLRGRAGVEFVMALIFVFGTLKEGFPLHAEALDGTTCLGSYKNGGTFPDVYRRALVCADDDGRARLRSSHKGRALYVDDGRLSELDRFESVGTFGNGRITVQVEPLGRGVPCRAFAYTKGRELAVPIHSALLDNYQDWRFVPPDRHS